MERAELPPELEQLIRESIREFGGIIRRVALASVAYGGEQAKAAMNEALINYLKANQQQIEVERNLEAANKAAHDDGVILPGEYGAVAQAIKMALNHFRSVAAGVTVPQILQQIHRMGAHAITDQQVRNTLKGMIKSGTATNPSRGMYGAGPKLPRTREAA